LQGYCKSCNRELAKIKAWKKQGIDIDVAGFVKLNEQQEAKCAICSRERSGHRSFEVDHDTTRRRCAVFFASTATLAWR
jgi:hypothetical protein